MVINGSIGDQHLMRLLNVGYRPNRFIFPSALKATVIMSDGRVLPSSFVADTLILYPGERYSVMAEIMDDAPSYVSVDYLDPYRLSFLGREYIPVNDGSFEYFAPSIVDNMTDTIGLSTAEKNAPAFKLFPNPAKSEVWISSVGDPLKRLEVYDGSGERVLDVEPLTELHQLRTTDWPTGLYAVKVTFGSGLSQVRRLVIVH